jgi:hypothetical protein
LRPRAAASKLTLVTREQGIFAIAALIAVELTHLKWIWWTQWSCSKCERKHKDCGCERKWQMYL